MIDLSPLAALLKHRHRLDAYCPRCDRWAELPLEKAGATLAGTCRCQ